MNPLSAPDDLAALVEQGASGLRVCDVRWYLGDPERGRREYQEGHVPGAVFVDLERDLCGQGGGRHPLPEPAAFAAALGRLGIEPTTRVVAYDAAGGAVAARLWWMLRSIGHEAAQVLDGGVQAWVRAGHRLTTAEPEVSPTVYPASPWTGVVDAVELSAGLGRLTVVDARAGERYRGEEEPIDPAAGHVPTAVSLPYEGNLATDGSLRPPWELAERYRDVAGPETVVYCGSGVTACHDVLAMEVAGLPRPRLYPGSWSDWSSDPGRPVATGAEPGEVPSSS